MRGFTTLFQDIMKVVKWVFYISLLVVLIATLIQENKTGLESLTMIGLLILLELSFIRREIEDSQNRISMP